MSDKQYTCDLQLKLRLYGSKCVVKYPRCSIKKQLTYADAEVKIIFSMKFLFEVRKFISLFEVSKYVVKYPCDAFCLKILKRTLVHLPQKKVLAIRFWFTGIG
jgi:hypothetical protein